MNQSKLNTCPVCGVTLENGLCPKCGYLRLIFPETIPQSLRNTEQRRVEVAQSVLSQIEKLEQEKESSVKKSNRDINELKTKLSDLKEELNSSNKENDRLSKECKNLQTEKKQLSKRIAVLEQDIEKTEINVSNQKSTHDMEISNLRHQLKSVQSEVQKMKDKPSQQLKGVVMIEDKRNDTRTMLPVYEGTNSYGTNPDNGLHHQIKFQVRGFSFHPVQFYIRTSSKGIIIEPSTGVEMTQNGGIVRSGVYARQSDNFMFGDRIRINITQI